MQFPTELFVDGNFCAGSEHRTLPIINPATEGLLVEVASASAGDVDRAIIGAQRAYEQSWRDYTPGRRTEGMFELPCEEDGQKDENTGSKNRRRHDCWILL